MSIAEQLMYECEQEIEEKLRECFVTKLDDIEDIEDLVREVADAIDEDITPICENYVWNHKDGCIKMIVDKWLEDREEEEDDD